MPDLQAGIHFLPEHETVDAMLGQEPNSNRSRKPLIFASVSTALAGFLDGVGYTQLNHLYVSFMSGNSAHLGIAVVAREWRDSFQAASVIGAFVMGSFAGTLISGVAPRPIVAILVAEILLCLISLSLALLGMATLALTLMALTMGMQNVMHQNISGMDVGKGFITSALFGLGQALADAALKKRKGAHALVLAWSWFSLILGVGCGAISVSGLGIEASLTIALSCLIAMTMMAAARFVVDEKALQPVIQRA